MPPSSPPLPSASAPLLPRWRGVGDDIALALALVVATWWLAAAAWGALAYPAAIAAGQLRWWLLPALLDGVLRDAAATGLVAIAAAALPRVGPWLAALVVGAAWTAQLTQVMAVRIAGGYLTTSDLRHIDHAAYAVPWPETLACVGVVLSLAVGTARMVTAAQARRGPAIRIASAAMLAAFAWQARDLPALREERDRAIGACGLVSGSPARALAETFVDLASGDAPTPTPGAAALALAGRYGLLLRPEASFPTLRASIWRDDPGLPRRLGAPPRPNLVVLFVESLSARLLEPYGGAYPGLTPQLQRLAGRCSVVRGWQNHVTPTVTGLRGQLCGLYPRLSYTPWASAAVMPREVRPTRCLPHVLADAGWRTHYWSHSPPDATWIRAQAHGWGFQETLMHQEVIDRWLPGARIARPDYGPSDRQLLAAVAAFLRSPAAGTGPFALAASTIETHIGTEPGPDWRRYPGRDHPLLHGLHNLDDALGPVIDALERGPRAHDTLLVVTADHALYPSAAYREVAPEIGDSRFDEVAMILCDPTHTLPPRLDWPTTSIDLAPTLAQLLGAPNQPVAWLGWSALADRWRYDGAVGLIYAEQLLTTGRSGARRGGEAEPARAALVQAVRWTQQLEADGRIPGPHATAAAPAAVAPALPPAATAGSQPR